MASAGNRIDVPPWNQNNYMFVPHDDGFYVEPKLWDPANPGKGRVRTNACLFNSSRIQATWDSPICQNRTICCGDKDPDSIEGDYSYALSPLPEGELNLAPIGLGTLLESNYLGDAKVFYCPSVGGSMPPPKASNGDIVAAMSLPELQRAGGFDADSMLHGDWAFLTEYHARSFDGGRAVLSDYAYRGLPITTAHGAYCPDTIYPRGVMPRVAGDIGCPAFKTQKLLGGRAVVADSYARYFDTGDFENPSPYWSSATLKDPGPIGNGWYGHREGYNVLYGDWHAKWYGDPQSRYLWSEPVQVNMPNGWGVTDGFGAAGTGGTMCLWNCLNSDGTGSIIGGTGAGNCSVYKTGSNTEGWHILDVAAGVDVGVDE